MTESVFSVADFRRLWFVGLASSVVRWLEVLAFGLIAYRTTESAFVVALLTMLRFAPMGLFGAFIGAAADRFDRQRALVLLVATTLAVALTLGVLASLGAIEVWHLAVASFISGTAWAADNPVRRMMIGDIVGSDRMGAAMSFDAATNNATRVVGPALAGVLLANLGVPSIFWFGATLYAFSMVAAMRVQMRRRAATAQTSSLLTSVREGLAWVRRDDAMIGVFAITIIFNVFGFPFTSMIPVIGTDALALGPEGVGLLASCEGIGGLIGALFIVRRTPPASYGRRYVTSVALYLAMVSAFALAPMTPLAAIALFLAGLFAVGFAVMQSTLVYRAAPVEMRARLLGVLSVCIGTAPIGFLYIGLLTKVLSPRMATIALAAQGLVAMLLIRRYCLAIIRS